MGQFSLFAQKVILNVRLDLRWMFLAPVPVSERAAYFLRKYAAIFTARKSILFRGRDFRFDNWLTPALLPEYIFELHHLAQIIPSRIRTVLDVGANVGQFAFTGRRIYNCSLGAVAGDAELYFVRGKSGQGSLHPENARAGLLSGDVVKVDVRVRRADDPDLELPRHFDLIKIDVEGSERAVLEGLSGLGWTYLYMELSAARSGGLSLEEALEILNLDSSRVIYSSSFGGASATGHAVFKNS